MAMEDWLVRARELGVGYMRWELAYNRRVDCKRADGPKYQCQAIGMPCTIRQVPSPDLEPIPP
jgi:hypothetical protein